MTFAKLYLAETAEIASKLDTEAIEEVVTALEKIRRRGNRVFVLGLGGSAANAEHCVNDLRVRGGLEAYSPQMAEWTARGNDQGWAVALKQWLVGSKLCSSDGVLFLSGSGESLPLVMAARYAHHLDARTFGILGAATSAIGSECDYVVHIPCPHERRAGHAEAFQAVVWHAIVAHPRLAAT
jgi:D-sedoheptulose 7-phosphate isomerase